MLSWLSQQLGLELRPRRIPLRDSYLDIDGVADDATVLVEAWAHQGPSKSAQKTKVMADAFRLLTARRVLERETRLILLFADETAARPFQAGTWQAGALREAEIDVLVADLPEHVRGELRAAQQRQYR